MPALLARPLFGSPVASQIINPPGGPRPSDITVVRDRELYSLRSYLVTSEKVWAKKRQAVEQFVRAIAKAGALVEANPDEFRKEIEQYFNYPDGWLKDVWNEVDFSFDTDPIVIKRLILKDAELAVETGIIADVPDVAYMLQQLPKIEMILGNADTK